jgi:hypothetical protein
MLAWPEPERLSQCRRTSCSPSGYCWGGLSNAGVGSLMGQAVGDSAPREPGSWRRHRCVPGVHCSRRGKSDLAGDCSVAPFGSLAKSHSLLLAADLTEAGRLPVRAVGGMNLVHLALIVSGIPLIGEGAARALPCMAQRAKTRRRGRRV